MYWSSLALLNAPQEGQPYPMPCMAAIVGSEGKAGPETRWTGKKFQH